MRPLFFALTALLTSAPALAMGYNCLSVDHDMQAIVYLKDSAALSALVSATGSALPTDSAAAAGSVGAVNAAVQSAAKIVFIDPELSEKSRVLAVFSEDDQVLSTSALKDGIRYTGEVDLSVPALNHPGKRLGGTKIGLLDQVVLDVQTVSQKKQIQSFSDGSMYTGQVSYVKKSGQTLTQDFDCSLFLGDQAPDIQN